MTIDVVKDDPSGAIHRRIRSHVKVAIVVAIAGLRVAAPLRFQRAIW